MRRAEWRKRADDPKTLFGWWWRGVSQRETLPNVALGLGIAGFCFSPSLWVLVTAFAVKFSLEAHSWLIWRDELRPLLPEPAPDGQFRVLVEFRRQGLATGSDEMALTIVDGWLHAEGVRSNFAVRPEDVWRLHPSSTRTATLTLADGSEIRLRGIRSEARVALEQWHVPDRWMEGDPTLPPSRVHPHELARRAAWMTSVPFSVLLISLARLTKTSLDIYVASLLGILALFVCALVWSFGRFLQLAQIDVSAKENEQCEALARQTPLHSSPPFRDEPLGEEPVRVGD